MVASIVQVQCKLNLARRVRGKDSPKSGRLIHIELRQIEMGPVQGIKGLRLESSGNLVRNPETPGQRDVHRGVAGTSQDVPARIAKRVLLRNRKRRRVKPLPRSRVWQVRRVDHIRAI